MLKREYPHYELFCEDESTFLYESISRKIWVLKGTKPRRTVTGSHTKIHIFGFFSEKKKRMFLQKNKINATTFLQTLSVMRRKFKRVILILDRAPWHRAKKVQHYLNQHNHTIKIVWFPRGCPEMNPVEECWRQSKTEVNGGRIHKDFETMRKKLRSFLKKAEFNQNMVKYLRP